MLKVIEIAFTGYPVTDMQRARAFYEGTLHLVPSQVWEHGGKQWVEYDIGPGTLALSNMAPEWKPSSDGPSIALELEEFDSAIEELKAAGVKFVMEPLISSTCKLALVQDPDGNTVAIHKRNPQ